MLRVGGAQFYITVPAKNTARFEEMSQRWRAVTNTVSDLTSPKFESLSPAPETTGLPLDQQADPRQYFNSQI